MNANRNSNFKNSNSNVRNNSKKPYCKVCHDAGKPESMYTSHCVKTYNINTGKTDTTCPTLLALECRYCYKNGHTVKFCPILEANKKMDNERARDRARQERPQHVQQQQQQAPNKTLRSAFAALAEESDDEEVQVQEVQVQEVQVKPEVDEFPSLMGNTRVVQNNNVKSYSCVAATPADERRLEMLRQQRLEATQKKAVTWADDSEDSDSEIEIEEEEEVEVKVTSNYVQQFAPVSYTYIPRATADDDDW
jgi:hypothetical protein